ncbi:MAG: hypothetical protein MHM6MM_000216 [Cercozoa sp. M6MM]
MRFLAAASLVYAFCTSSAVGVTLTRPSTFVDTSTPVPIREIAICVSSSETTCGATTAALTAHVADETFMQVISNDQHSMHMLQNSATLWLQTVDDTSMLLRTSDLECTCGRSSSGLQPTSVNYVSGSGFLHIVFPPEANTGDCTRDADTRVLLTCYSKNVMDAAGATSDYFERASTALLVSQVDKAVTEWETELSSTMALQIDLEAVNSTVSSNAAGITANTDSIATLGGTVSANSADIASLNTSILANTDSVSANTADIASLNTSAIANTGIVAGLVDSVASLNGTVTANAADIASLNSTVITNIDSLTASSNMNSGNITSLSTVVSELQDSIAQLNSTRDSNCTGGSSDSDIAGLNVTVSNNTDTIESLTAAVQALTARVATLEAIEGINQKPERQTGLTGGAASTTYAVPMILGAAAFALLQH